MNRISGLVIVSVALGCGRADVPKSDPPTEGIVADTIAPAWAIAPSRQNVECLPKVVGPNDRLRITMGQPHGSSLFISGPDGTPFIVVFHPGTDRGARQSMMTPDKFKQLDEVSLKVSDFKAGVWVFGRDTNENVFVKPGTYRVRIGDDLETDGPSYAECLVSYRPD